MKQAAIRKFSTYSNVQPLSADTSTSSSSVTKKSVPGPTSPMHFFSLFLFHIFRKPMSVDPLTKAGIYLCIAAAGSLFFDFVPVPPSYFSNKRNVFNMLFVKWAWGWTFVLTSVFICFSSFVYTGGNVKLIRAHAMRLIAGSACWYTMTGFFNYVFIATGRCHSVAGDAERAHASQSFAACSRAGGRWVGFDISGHCFLLVMANLWILEELKCLLFWSKLSDIIQPFSDSATNQGGSSPTVHPALRHVDPERLRCARSAFQRLTGSVRALFSLTACLSMLWDFMFFMTVIYFHTMPSKLFGTLCGVACWYVCYRILFPLGKTGALCSLSPGRTGDGLVDFVTHY